MRRFLTLLSFSALVLAGCQNIPEYQRETARRTALPVFMIPRIVPAEPFTLQAYERVHKKFDTAVLYIEGDGEGYSSPTDLNLNNTPADPIALRMAAQDGRPNVIWLGRPCQYHTKYMNKDDCPAVFTADGKFSEAVLEGYNRALDNIKAYNDVTNFEIVGWDGGAAIATILAAQRNDIVSLRTVAGNLDTKTTAYLNKVEAPTHSLNPVDYASKLTAMPQRHFIGKLDHVEPPAVYSSFAQAMGPTSCNAVSLIDDADHEHGWVEQWKTLVTMPVACTSDAASIIEPPPVPFDPTTLDGDKGHRGKYDKKK